MLFDTHTNLMWYPEHLSDEFVEFAWEAKRAKMKLSPDVYFAGGDSAKSNAFDSRPEQLLKATAEADVAPPTRIPVNTLGQQHRVASRLARDLTKVDSGCHASHTVYDAAEIRIPRL